MSLIRFKNQQPSLFNRFFDDDMFDWYNRNYSETNTTLPSVNVKESPDGFEVEVAVPGFDKKDFNIELNDDLLTISSEKKVENEVKEGEKFTKREFSYQSFSRSFSIPVTVERDKITAKYEKGLLKVYIPKKEDSKPVKQISIS
jgi:HSP20 family protein